MDKVQGVNRLQYIKNKIITEKYVEVQSLSQVFGVSDETIRRDLAILEKDGILKRIYGGAYFLGGKESDISIHIRKSKKITNKLQIADICADLIDDDDTIFLDSSTTCLEIAKRIADFNITVITNSLYITNHLSVHSNIRTITIGGSLDTVNMCFFGQSTLSELDNYHARKSFISCRTISDKYGAMDSNENIAQIRAKAMTRCYENYLVADHTKFGQTSLYKIAQLDEFSAVITDVPLGTDWVNHFDEIGVRSLYGNVSENSGEN